MEKRIVGLLVLLCMMVQGIWAHGGSNLTLTSSVAGGSIEGGKANNGGAIHIPHGNTVTATNVIFQNNTAASNSNDGGIWNGVRSTSRVRLRCRATRKPLVRPTMCS